jgi:hypothetical protein
MPIYILFIIEYPFFTSAAYKVMDILDGRGAVNDYPPYLGGGSKFIINRPGVTPKKSHHLQREVIGING